MIHAINLKVLRNVPSRVPEILFLPMEFDRWKQFILHLFTETHVGRQNEDKEDVTHFFHFIFDFFHDPCG